MFSKLPLELIEKIISYDGTLKYRYGRWMDQIPKEDIRYSLLQKFPPSYVSDYGINSWRVSIYLSMNCKEESYPLFYNYHKMVFIYYDEEQEKLEYNFRSMKLTDDVVLSSRDKIYIRK
jgi:hypothetical protein